MHLSVGHSSKCKIYPETLRTQWYDFYDRALGSFLPLETNSQKSYASLQGGKWFFSCY